MWSLEDEDGDLSDYFRLIEDEANELRERVEPPKPRPFKNENAEDNKVTENNVDPNDINNNTNDNNNINGGNANQPQPMDVTVRVEPTQDNGKQHSTEDDHKVDGFKPPNFNLYLAGYAESDRQTIRHINLIIEQRSDLLKYLTHILECSFPDSPVLIIHQDKQLAHALAFHLRNEGFWSVNITDNKTAETAINIDDSNNTSEQLNGCLTTFRCILTTIKYLRDCPDVFKMRPLVVINFNPILPCIKYLERWLNYRADKSTSQVAAGAPLLEENKKEEIFLYQICFPSYDEL